MAFGLFKRALRHACGDNQLLYTAPDYYIVWFLFEDGMGRLVGINAHPRTYYDRQAYIPTASDILYNRPVSLG